MGIYSDIQEAISEAFDTDLSDAVSDFILVRLSSGGYSPNTGNNTPSETEYPSRGAFTGYETKELYNKGIMPTDTKLILIDSEIDTKPIVNDLIRRGSDEFKVVSVKSDPANAHWELQCRM